MSTISPKGMNAASRTSFVTSGDSEETCIVLFVRAVAVAAMLLVQMESGSFPESPVQKFR